MADKDKHNWLRGWLVSIIWLVGAVSDRIWFALDHSVPAWDQADYLTGSLNYWRALQHPQWLESDWWTSLWLLSSKIPPLTYITTAVVQHVFGTGLDQATLVNLLFSGILLGSVYGLGVQLFSVEVGLWAAGLCQLLPGLYQYKLDFLLDYPLAAVVTLSFWCLTVWRAETAGKNAATRTQRSGWLWAAAFGICFGLALLVKQTALLFLLTPVLWVGVGALKKRSWGRLAQLVGGLLLSVVVFGPWYRTNWLTVLTSGKRATVDSAIAEGDPALNTLAAWTYYWNQLPHQVSWPLLIVPIVGLLLYWKRSVNLKSLGWLAVFWVGSYLLSSLNINKDDRYVVPYLPVLSVFLAYCLTLWPREQKRHISWGTVSLLVLLMFVNIFPVGGTLGNAIAQALTPNAQHQAYLQPEWPHSQVIDEIMQADPYLRTTLGVLPSTPEINQHNLNYYGALKDFQVYGRQVGTRTKQVSQDARSLSWFLTKTGNQGSVPKAQAAMVQVVEQERDFQLHKTWNLPDDSILKLYHTQTPPLQVQPIAEFKHQESEVILDNPLQQKNNHISSTPNSGLRTPDSIQNRIALSQVTVPEQAPPGVPLPVTYEWSGPWKQLQSGLVLLTWRQNSLESGVRSPESNTVSTDARWLHDHGIGMGTLHSGSLTREGERWVPALFRGDKQAPVTFQVIERMAMLPPADVPAGIYALEATYLNRNGESYPISVPQVTLKIDPKATATPAPELDLVTQLRHLGTVLPKGPNALGPVFEEIGRINQYDPIQDYLVQTQIALESRLQLEPQNRDWAYAVALSKVLARQVNGAIKALEQVTRLDSQNPYAYAYLAFVHLYNWNPKAADAALKPALTLNPNLPEIQALDGIAALMQGNFVKAWHYAQPFLKTKH